MIVKTERKWLYMPLPVGPIGLAIEKARAEKAAKAETRLENAINETRENFLRGKAGF